MSDKYKSLLLNQDDYTFVRQLPENGVSVAKLMENKKTKRNVVFKVNHLLKQAAANSDGSPNLGFYGFVNEVSQLVHPAINPMEGCLHPNEKFLPTIVYSYQPNGSINIRMIRTLNPTKKWVVAIGIASAIKYLHTNKVYDLNLKPSNILLDENFHPKLADFGFAKKEVFNNKPTQNIPTIMYKSPEHLTQIYPVSPKSDIYSFALILYLIFAERCAYNDNDNPITQMMSFARGYRPHIFDGVPQVVQDLIRQMWSTDPASRPSSAAVYDTLINGIRELVDSLEFNIIVPYFRDIFNYEHGCALASFGDAHGRFISLRVLYNSTDAPNIQKMCLDEIKVAADAGEVEARQFMRKVTGEGYEDAKSEGKDIQIEVKKKSSHKTKAIRPKVSDKKIVEAANAVDREKIRSYLNDDVDVNSTDKEGDTALHVACRKCDIVLAQLLLSIDNVNVNIQNKKGHTPLHEAARFGATDIVSALLLNKSIKLTIPDKMGYSALDWATKDDMVKALTSAGAKSCKAEKEAENNK